MTDGDSLVQQIMLTVVTHDVASCAKNKYDELLNSVLALFRRSADGDSTV